MSYRTYANGVQIFGNNECPDEWIEELKRQGCEIDSDFCYNDFEVKDFTPLLRIAENYAMENMDGSFDFTKLYQRFLKANERLGEYHKIGYLDFLEVSIIDETYAFTPYVFFKACEDCLEYIGDDSYKIKDGCKIIVSAG